LLTICAKKKYKKLQQVSESIVYFLSCQVALSAMVRSISKSCRHPGAFYRGATFFRLIWALVLVLGSICHNQDPACAVSLSDDLPRQKVVMIDPGHGGDDLGAVGPSGLAEKAVTLSVAQKMREILSVTYEVHLTRNGDFAIDLEERTGAANHHRADVFISLHAGGAFGHQSRGTAIFYYGHGGSLESPASEEYGDTPEISEEPIPWDEVQGKHQARAQLLAGLVHRHLREQISPVDIGMREAPCLVLSGADMPAIVVEIAHVSHPAEEAQLKQPETIEAAAEAISEAIKEYFTNYP
jgi:N-acetylmuramoyl-L-alanine amidase